MHHLNFRTLFDREMIIFFCKTLRARALFSVQSVSFDTHARRGDGQLLGSVVCLVAAHAWYFRLMCEQAFHVIDVFVLGETVLN